MTLGYISCVIYNIIHVPVYDIMNMNVVGVERRGPGKTGSKLQRPGPGLSHAGLLQLPASSSPAGGRLEDQGQRHLQGTHGWFCLGGCLTAHSPTKNTSRNFKEEGRAD